MIEEKYLKKLEKLRVSAVARDCGISRQSVYNILKGRPVSESTLNLIRFYLDRGL